MKQNEFFFLHQSNLLLIEISQTDFFLFFLRINKRKMFGPFYLRFSLLIVPFVCMCVGVVYGCEFYVIFKRSKSFFNANRTLTSC